jgi:hypothetical protein
MYLPFDMQTNRTSKSNLIGYCEIDLSDIFSSVSWMASSPSDYFAAHMASFICNQYLDFDSLIF